MQTPHQIDYAKADKQGKTKQKNDKQTSFLTVADP